jgi:hypothetical protein
MIPRIVKPRCAALGLAVVVCLLGLFSGIGRGQVVWPEAAPVDSVLVMRSGEVFQGRITKNGDRFVVHVPVGEVSLRASDVDFIAASLMEAYARKRERVQPDSAEEHAELAQWCQRQGLLEAAWREIGEARTLDPSLPMTALIQRRLEIAAQQNQAERSPGRMGDAPATSEDLDRLVRGMPPGTVEQFTQTIQPLLMNHCAASGCHSNFAPGKFSLLKVPAGRPPSRHLTQRNLIAVMQLIDGNQPAASPILTVPVRPHGGSKAAVFTDQQVAQYREMVNWVYRVTRPSATADHAVATSYEQESPLDPARLLPGAASSSSQPAELSTAESIRPSYSTKMRVTRSRSHDPVGHPAVAVPGKKNSEEPAGSPQEPRAVPGAEKPAADPFDPEVFNRQFAPPPVSPDQNAAAGPFPSPDAPPGNPQNLPEQPPHDGQPRQ